MYIIGNRALRAGGALYSNTSSPIIIHGNTEFIENHSDTSGGAIYTAGCPDPDLIVRTGGDMRISNFLLWQAAYAEFYFTDKLWPDFTTKDVDLAIENFTGRKRRFGGV